MEAQTTSLPKGFDAIIEALTIFRKYDNPTYPFHCEHDTLTVCVDPFEVSRKDLARLEALGFDAGGEYEDVVFSSCRWGSA